jgi:hypothetical protein
MGGVDRASVSFCGRIDSQACHKFIWFVCVRNAYNVRKECRGRGFAVTILPVSSDQLQLHSSQSGYAILGRRSFRISQLWQRPTSISTRQDCAQLLAKGKWSSWRDAAQSVFLVQIFGIITLSDLRIET